MLLESLNIPLTKNDLPYKIGQVISSVARAFPGGRIAHPEGQNEEENGKKLREKNDQNLRKK